MPEKKKYWQKVTIHTPLNGAAGADPYSACALFLMQPGTRTKVTSRKKKQQYVPEAPASGMQAYFD